MRYFSLFTGVGGFELGIQKAYVASTDGTQDGGIKGHPTRSPEDGARLLPSEGQGTGHADGRHDERADGQRLGGKPACVGFSEIDKHASAVLRYRFPNVPNHGDITQIDWSLVSDFDLLVGGSPCQSFSIAGKRKGLEGASGLFVEYVRCLKEKKPQHFIWENVKGVLSSGQGADFAYILDAFSEAGYSLTWQVLNAKHFGVPQNRERVFVIGHLGTEPSRKVFFVPADDGVRPPTPPSEEKIHDVAQAQTARQYASWGGNYAIHEITAGQDQAHRVYDPSGIHRTNAANGGGLGAKMGLVSVQRCGDRDKNTFSTMEVSHTLPANPMSDYLPKITDFSRVRRLTPSECMRLMSWPFDHCDFGDYGDGIPKQISDSQKYKMAGNGVVSDVIAAIVKEHLLLPSSLRGKGE